MEQHIARQVADRETNAYIARKGFTPWQVANEPAIQNEIDQVWNEYLREAQAELAQDDVMYACDGCAHDIKVGGVSDDEGYLELTGKPAINAVCDLCAAPATHEVRHAQEAQA